MKSTRGTVFFVLGVLSIAFFDHDVTHLTVNHPEGVHKSLLIHKLYELFSNFGLSDHKVGVVILLAAVCLDAGFAAYSRNLVASIGGSKRLHALSSGIGLVMLVPLFFMSKIYSWSFITISATAGSVETSSLNAGLSSLLWLAVIGAVFQLDFYFTSLVSTRLGSHLVTRLSKLCITMTGLILCFLWSSIDTWSSVPLPASPLPPINPLELDPSSLPITASSVAVHQLSTGVLFAMVCILYASTLLTNVKPGQGPDGSSSGHFIGYSMAGLPLFTIGHTPSHGLAMLTHPETMSVWYHVRTTMKSIMSEQSSRRIFAFLCLNLSFTFVELLYGVWTNSLGLISDGFHMLFDSAALVVGLYAAVVAQWKPTRLFSYGFHSAEVLSGFVNALFLMVISGSIFVNALARIHHPPHIHTDRLMAVSVAGLVVNLFGILALGHAHSHGGGGGHNHGHSHSSNPTKHSHGTGGHGHSHGTGGHGHSHGTGGHGHSHGTGGHGHSHGTGGHGHSHGSSSHEDSDLHYGHAHGHKQHTGSHEHADDGHEDSNLRGVYLHVLADTLGSVGVIFSSFLVSTYGWNIADPICSVFIACAIGYSATPLLRDTVSLLTLRAPVAHRTGNPELVVDKVLSAEGVLAVYNPVIWSQTRETASVSLCVQVDETVSEQLILAHIKELLHTFCPKVTHLTVQVEKAAILQNHYQALGLKPIAMLYYPKHGIQQQHGGCCPSEHATVVDPKTGRRHALETVSIVMPNGIVTH